MAPSKRAVLPRLNPPKRKRRRNKKASPASTASPLPQRVQAVLEVEQSRLYKAHELLKCLAVAANHDDSAQEFDPAAVAKVTGDMLGRVIAALDELLMPTGATPGSNDS